MTEEYKQSFVDVNPYIAHAPNADTSVSGGGIFVVNVTFDDELNMYPTKSADEILQAVQNGQFPVLFMPTVVDDEIDMKEITTYWLQGTIYVSQESKQQATFTNGKEYDADGTGTSYIFDGVNIIVYDKETPIEFYPG